MTLHKPICSARQSGAAALALVLGLALGGCATMPQNRLLDSVHQPVVDRTQYQIDLASGPAGLTGEDRGRLEGWFAALGLRYGDEIAIDDPLANPTTRAEVRHIVDHYGLLISDATPVTAGYVNAGMVRVIVTRSTASVPHCPDLQTTSEINWKNATSSNYGCAVNSNMAAMVANPNDFLSGRHAQTLTTVDTADKAIWNHQSASMSGAAGTVKQNGTN
ncbi:MAG: CpaD family pilus assembly protein [Sphingomonadales bacterium]|nr:CpaD family pilus assembly protein [Sphingomonadales bacterium]